MTMRSRADPIPVEAQAARGLRPTPDADTSTTRPAAGDAPKTLRNAEPDEFRIALAGLDFPSSKPAILNKARDKGGLDREVPHVLAQVEERTYKSWDDIEAEIERIYAQGGGLPIGGPAAPA